MEHVRPRRRRAGSAVSGWDAAVLALRAIGLVALVAGAVTPPVRAADTDVSIVDFAFEPGTVMIAAGDTVTWTVTRAQDPHTVSPVGQPGAFEASGLLRQGDSFIVTFAQPGTYPYECTIHPEDMQATVIVQSAAPTAGQTASATPTPTPALPSTPAPLPPSPESSPTAPADGSPAEGGGLLSEVVVPLILLGAAALAGAWLVARSRRGGA